MPLPTGPTPAHVPPAYTPAASFPPTLNMPSPEITAPSVPTGIMKDVSLFKNPFDIPRDQLLRYLIHPLIKVPYFLIRKASSV